MTTIDNAPTINLDIDEARFLAEVLSTPGLNIPLGADLDKMRCIVRVREKLAPYVPVAPKQA